MCGIVGYVGARSAQELLVAGLEKLEYRGYDSAGISLLADGDFETVRTVGNLAALRDAVHARAGGSVAVADRPATIGIGHTRWATHGRVSVANAHPHNDTADRVHIVLNGIVENFRALRDELVEGGAEFTSATDAEVVAHLIARELRTGGTDLAAAVQRAYARLEGHYAFVAIARDEPGVLVAARKECPLIVGRGDGEQFLASAIPAFLRETDRVQYLEDDELAIVRADGVEFRTAAGEPVERPIETVDWDISTAEKGGYETFMLKEIHEQGDALAETIGDRTTRPDGVDLGDLGAVDDALLRRIRRIVVVACGTSYHAGLTGRYAIEAFARVPVELDVASEYRYRDPVVHDDDLVIGISQSGETADTLAAMRLARERGATVLALTNVMGSHATRAADGVLYTRAGPEVSVAATKTFTAQVAAMMLLALRLAELRGTLDDAELRELVADLKSLPHRLHDAVDDAEAQAEKVARQHYRSDFFLYLGRHIGLPVALEGALKLKEISYIATDAYAAGEMKHGPIALLDDRTPVVCVATESPVTEKVVSNMQEVQARGAHVIAVATEGDTEIAASAEQVITVPHSHAMFQPILAIVPLQLLAYHIARLRELNVDQPRNLAKTVTVE